MTDAPRPRYLFSGDWEYLDGQGTYLYAFEAVILRDSISGWARPVVTERVLEAIAARQTLLRLEAPEMDYAEVWKDGEHGAWYVRYDETTYLIERRSDGFYDADLGICWYELGSEDRVLNIIRSTEEG